MNVDVVYEFSAQALLIRVALEGLSAVMAIMFCLTSVAFIVYLIGVWRLCHAEYRLRK